MIIEKKESNWQKSQRLELEAELAKMIKLEDCKDRYLYRISARNLSIGVYNAERQEFFGIRTKFGSRFLDSENHWDCESFATVKPMEELEKLPDEIELGYKSEDLFKWIEEKERKYVTNRPEQENI